MYFAIQTLNKDEYGNFSYNYGLLPLISIPFYSFIYYPLTVFHDKINIKVLRNLGLKISIICSLLVLISSFYINTIYAVILIVALVMAYIYEFKRRLFLITMDIPRMTILQLSRMFLFLSLLYFFPPSGGEGFFAILILSSFIAFFMVKSTVKNTVKSAKKSIDLSGFSTPILKSNLIDNVSVYGSSYLAIIYLDSSGLAELNAPRIVLGVFTILSLALENIIGRDVSEAAANKGKLLSALLPYKIYFIFAIAALIIMTIYRENITDFLLKSDYNSRGLTIYIYSGFIMVFTRPIIIYLRASRFNNLLPRISLMNFAFSLLALVFIHVAPTPENFIIVFLLTTLFQFIVNLYYHIKLSYAN